MSKIFTKYSIEARFFPAIIGLIPFYALQYFYLKNYFDFNFLKLEVISNISLSVIILYLFAELVIRYLGKIYEDKKFKNRLHFPSTNFIMFGDKEYGDDFKIRLREKIKNDFSLELLNKKEELENEKEARLKIKDAVGLMINEVKDGRLLLGQNIVYGLARNLWPSSNFGLLFSIILFFASAKNNNSIFIFSIFLISFYSLYIFLGKYVIDYFSRNYAKKLIEEYYYNN